MTNRVLVASFGLLATIGLVGCGDSTQTVDPDGRPVWLYDASLPDAALPDAAPPPDACPYTMCGYFCVDLTSDTEHCGDCDKTCSRAAACTDGTCSCPSDFVPQAVTDADPPASFITDNLPDVSLRASFVGKDDLTHQLRVYWNADTIETGVEYDLASVETPSVSISYNWRGDGPRGTFVPTSGKLRLSRVCNDGIAGTVTGASFAEIAWGPGGGDLIPDGCTFDLIAVAFIFGSECPAE